LSWKGDSVTIKKCENLVVIKDCVHGLNPEGIDRAVENHPSLGFRFFLAKSGHHGGKHSFVPFQIAINVAEELLSVDGFRIEVFILDSWVFFVLFAEGVESAVQDFPYCGLSALRSAHQHVSVTGVFGVVKLNNLLDLFWLDHQLHSLQLLLNRSCELLIRCLLQLNVGEQVVEQRVEQWNVFLHKLWQVHVPDGFH
jgi:hypothetical protein